ncbi:MAG: hypothetical protein FWG58_05250 [Methanomassiliicoccaceae archaeon]|nr:hypothetical protein [Methanomassiliicoccaceae archaeon]
MEKEIIRKNAHVSELSLVRKNDKLIMFIFLFSMAVCVLFLASLLYMRTVEMIAALILVSVPFFIVGLVTYVGERMWKALLAAIAIIALLFFIDLPLTVMFFVGFLMVGCVGVVSVAALFQRALFFSVISAVEYMNIKDKLSLWERLVSFAFNIPPHIDTRKITMEYNLKRSGIPVKEMMQTMSFAFLVGLMLWIYLSMNPALSDIGLFEAPIYVFSLVMFIPLLVLPFTPFKSLNVRIETNYRPFSLYSGIFETLRRMAVPVFAVFLFILVAVSKLPLMTVAGFIASSVAFNMVVVAASAIIFYLFFESAFVDDAVAKWKIFRPVRLDMELEYEERTEDDGDLPGTPERDLCIGDVDIT